MYICCSVTPLSSITFLLHSKNYSSRVHKTNLLSNNGNEKEKSETSQASSSKCGATYFNTNTTSNVQRMDGTDEKEMHVHQRKEYIKFCMSIVQIDICPENSKCVSA